jgi:hypothetical protein
VESFTHIFCRHCRAQFCRAAALLVLCAVPLHAQDATAAARRAQAFLAERQTAGAAAGSLLAARAQHLAMMQELSPQSLTPLTGLSTVWQAVGPAQIASGAFGDVTGRITGIAIDPADATGNTVYLATTGGGVWKSENAAGAAASITFTPLTDTLPVFNGANGSAAIASLSIGAITVQPGGTRVVLAGTGDPNDALDSYYGSGLLRSTDAGQTWSLLQNSLGGVAGNHSFVGEGFAGFAWSTASPNLVVAAVSQAAEGTITNAGTNDASVRGLYYSTDAGATWQMATISDSSHVVQSAQSDFTSYSGNAATAVVWNPIRQRFYAAVRFHGYYQSSDGMNWTRLTNQPGTKLTATNCPVNPNATGSTACPIFRGALAVNPTTGDTFALAVDVNNLDQGLWQDACALSGNSCTSSTVAFGTQIPSTALEVSAANTAIAQGVYNLTLAAVPTGSGATADTLLFAGATDIFRCALSAGCVLHNTTNASNGCTTPAMVAPAQHAIAALALPTGATQPLLFFGNDGGLWRSTDGVNQQGSACAAGDAGHFQNLNSGLGSLAEIVHFAESTADGNTFLAGAGTLGTAATTAAAAQSAWPQVSAGEGGYNAMDASNPLNWYIATGPGVNVNLCTKGSGCAASDFATTPVVGSTQTAADVALIDAPFLLDPALQSNLIAGTCRIWRGPGSGGGLWSTSNLLSAMLDGVAEPECTTSNGAVRSLAAGGAVNGGSSAQHAGSQVIYAGLAGLGDGGGTKGGHLFATTTANTATSATTWTDLWSSPVTNDPTNNRSAGNAQFNPGLFDVSSIAVDTHDATGATVYATVMGFSGNGISEPHVYRSTDGGAHWANISSNLPDAPANSVLVDPNSANTVYVALDTGVYVTTAVSTCATAGVNCWSVYGTALPNAPVTQLAAVTGTAAGSVTGLLRAGTYGRGIWQIPLETATVVQAAAPAIQLSATLLTFAAQQAQTASAAQSITVTNTGNASLTISQIVTSGDFTETDNCITATIAANGTCTVMVSFLPSTSGPRSGMLTLFANVTGGQATASLSGTGLAPAAITLTPAALIFTGNTLLGTTSAPMTILVTNTGGVSTPLQTPVLTGDFAVSNNTCGASLAANAACGIAIAFTPTVSGARSGSFAITDSAGTQTATLSGTGAAAATDTISTASLMFAAQTVGTTSAVQTVNISNSGDLSLQLTSVAATGDFTAVNSCGAFLIAHTVCAISVVYVPRGTGAAAGTLSLTDVNRTQTVALSGSGLAPAGVSLTPFTLNFGNIGLGHASAEQAVTLTNNGGSPLTISSVTISGDYALASNNCPSLLMASNACTFMVSFAPTGTGLRMGSLTVADTAASSPQTVPLSGTGVEFGFALSSNASQTVSTLGGTAGYSILIMPASGLTGTLTLSCTGAPANASCIVAPATADLSTASTLIQVNVSTAVKHSAVPGLPGTLWLGFLLPLVPMVLQPRRRVAVLMLLCILLTGCGAGRLIPSDSAATAGVTPTPAGTYTLMVTATDSVSLAQHSVPLTLVVQ